MAAMFWTPPAAIALALSMLALGALSAAAEPLPRSVGQCSVTAVKQVQPRLQGMPNSGSAISYHNGATRSL